MIKHHSLILKIEVRLHPFRETQFRMSSTLIVFTKIFLIMNLFLFQQTTIFINVLAGYG